MSHVILLIYRVLTFIMVWPLCLVVRNHPNFKHTLLLRLSLKLPTVPPGDLVWFHGASLGEIKALTSLIETVKSRRPQAIICLSAMTAAGRQAAAAVEGVNLILPLPFDARWIMKRYMRHLAPKTIVIAETEIWPNMLTSARTAGIPVTFVNARVSAKAFERYKLVKPLIGRLLGKARILAMANEHAVRFKALGADDVHVLDNVKFDAVHGLRLERAQTLRVALNIGARPVFIAGSIREGEEQAVMEAISAVREKIPKLFSIVAPRHHDRIKYVSDPADRYGIPWALRSIPSGNADLLILDTVGELFDLYGLAQAAFVGGSLVDLGGQNILEPIAWGVPTLHGPYMGNFLWAMDVVGDHTIQVADAAELAQMLISILSHPETYASKANMARAALDSARGATQRYADELLKTIPE